MKVHGLILAAGDSSRLGQPKQLIQFKDQSLLQRIETNLLSCLEQVWVVLGYEHKKMQTELTASHVINNPDWACGMGHSLALGTRIAGQQADGLLVALCDQPHIPISHYQQLIKRFKQKQHCLVNTQYANTQGVPAIFPNHLFSQLHSLNGQYGAQNLFAKHQKTTQSVSCEAAGFDLDTPEDLQELLSD